MNQISKQVAFFGECMLELQGQAFGTLPQSYGGDTLNTAVYLARCGASKGIQVCYATALGDDSLSTGMLQRWGEEGIDLSLVRRLPGRMPGLYMIEVDPQGERSFSYWRDASAAKSYFDTAQTPLEVDANRWHSLYISGISLAILPPPGRERLFALMQSMRERGAGVVFDNNYRPRLWPKLEDAQTCFDRALALATTAFVTADDHQALYRLGTLGEAVAHAQTLACAELVIKRGAMDTLVRSGGGDWQNAPTQRLSRVVDTTAAGDSFAAGYLAKRLQNASAVDAAIFGNALAARVISHQGALIAPALMADLAAS